MVKTTVHNALDQTRHSRNGKRKDMLQDSISKMLYNETKRRPMVFSIINEH
jgi:mRNA degradation ribonuclease J1/J2